MPKRQFLFSAVFTHQKSYKGNILGIGRNKSPRPYFPRSVPEHRRRVGEGQQGAHTIWRRGWPPGRAQMCGGSPLAPPTLPLRLYIAPDAKTLKRSVIFHQGFRSAAAIDDKFRGTESLFRHAAGTGNCPRSHLHRHHRHLHRRCCLP